MINHWEEYQAGPTQPMATRVHVTLDRRNVIMLNANLYEQLGKPKAAVLLFDKINSVIGIRPDSSGRANAFPVKQKTGSSGRLIRATPFCQHYGVKVDRTTTFPTAEIDADGVLRLDLKTTTEIGRRRKSSQNREP